MHQCTRRRNNLPKAQENYMRYFLQILLILVNNNMSSSLDQSSAGLQGGLVNVEIAIDNRLRRCEVAILQGNGSQRQEKYKGNSTITYVAANQQQLRVSYRSCMNDMSPRVPQEGQWQLVESSGERGYLQLTEGSGSSEPRMVDERSEVAVDGQMQFEERSGGGRQSWPNRTYIIPMKVRCSTAGRRKCRSEPTAAIDEK